jgi:uncharacterized protein YjiS (DUF1127 family)
MISRFEVDGLASFAEGPMAGLNDNAGAKRSMRSASRLSPLQRAYLMGFRRARIYARRDVTALADPSEAVSTELRGVRRELERLRAIDYALEAERDDTLRLGESAQGSRPVAFSTNLGSEALLTAPSTPFLISRLTGVLRTWRRRVREREELAGMSQAELRDIGISSVDRLWEIGKPFWRNGSDWSLATATRGIGVTMLQWFIWHILNPPGRVVRAIWIYFQVVSQLEALPDHDFRHMPISKRDAPAIAWDDAMRSLAEGDVSWSFVGLAWAILLAALIGGAVAALH